VPTYQYACTACGEQHEAVQAFSDAPLTECPACGGTLRKVFSAVGVVFKGSGFYKTDSRSSAKKESAGSGSGDGASTSAPAAKTESSSSTAAKTDSKPASTPAAKTA
jgi:putative FmdB family regulatory protein